MKRLNIKESRNIDKKHVYEKEEEKYVNIALTAVRIEKEGRMSKEEEKSKTHRGEKHVKNRM